MYFVAIGTVISNIWGKVWPVAVALLLFALLITVHEFGHFSVAKLLKVKVNEFSIGFGPKIFSKVKGDTKYSLRLIPAGGFCAMEGEDEESTDENAFCNKSVFKRILIVIAGAVYNIIFGLILVMIMLAIDGAYGTPVIHSFQEDAVSNLNGGLAVGDKILEVDGRNVYCHDDILYFLTNSEDEIVDITVLREDQEMDLDVTFNKTEFEGNSYIYIDMIFQGERCSVKRPFTFIKQAALKTVSIARLVWISIIDMVSGRYGLNEIMGPVGTVGTVSEAASQSIRSLLYIMSMITVNLGVFNLLPFPALDGGKFILLSFEGITRKKISSNVESYITIIGLGLLLLLMLVITVNDILRWF